MTDSQNERDNQDAEDDVADQENTLQAQQAVNEETEDTPDLVSTSDVEKKPNTSLESDDGKEDKPEQVVTTAETAAVEENQTQQPKQHSTSPKKEKQGDSSQPAKNPEDVDLDLLLDIPLEIKVELGRAKVPIHNLLNFGPGSAVKLLKLEGEPVDILANDTLIAKGEVVVVGQCRCVTAHLKHLADGHITATVGAVVEGTDDLEFIDIERCCTRIEASFKLSCAHH